MDTMMQIFLSFDPASKTVLFTFAQEELQVAAKLSLELESKHVLDLLQPRWAGNTVEVRSNLTPSSWAKGPGPGGWEGIHSRYEAGTWVLEGTLGEFLASWERANARVRGKKGQLHPLDQLRVKLANLVAR